ncbi:phosphatase PAP2 family protein [Phycicoccus sp. HDW14]|uniref:phosphatase PAP2 family protein n=1 Tax=Phycicoccus sp. HDW14 TaxID=2714941 RepID=UPI00140B2FB2|nr:phosphatase PAP2 family protein [Phycicoccus sp. HDW14]QIM22242.1 phosphatase PAP2 family protein [Phycicoccus sp. HDW14]
MSFLTRWDDDPSRPGVREVLRDLAVRAVLPGVLVFAVVCAIGWVIMEPLRGLESENDVSRWFQDRRTPTGETITKFMSMIGNTEYVIAVGVLVALVVLWRTRAWWFALVPILAISLQATIFVIAAYVVGRPRPTVERLDPTPPTSSYPSGHVGASTALYVSFVLMATRLPNPVVRRVVITLCVVAPLLVTFARLYRGAHHVTDVLVGLANGIVCALLAWGYLRRDPAKGQSRA